MNIILISECSKSSAKKSRRILSKYARNIARRTWIAAITEEGLAYLQQELVQVANKNTAVACHKIISRSEIALAWIVGSHKKFDREGNFAFRYTENLADQYRIELSALSRNYIKFFSQLNKLAGLFHDVGKNFYYFQHKLIHNKKGKQAGDPIRHEYLSFLCFLHVYDFSAESYTQQLSNLKQNINTLDLDDLQSTLNELAEESYFNQLFGKTEPQFVIAKLLAHLILSHHRLISGSKAIEKKTIHLSDSNYFNQIYHELTPSKLEQIFQLYQQQDFVLFDQHWREQVGYSIDHLVTLLNNHATEFDALTNDDNVLMSVAHYILRPALIMADQRVSARLSHLPEGERNKPDYTHHHALANKKGHENNQSLQEHLRWVGKQSFKNNKVLWQSILSRQRLYSIEPSKKLLKPVAKALPQFHWQDAAVRAIKRIDKPESFGFFAVVMAKTGAGKTQANAKVMAALNPNLRFSTLLGLRTLTLQTLDEYQEYLGIKKQNILGIIGDNTTRRLHDADKKDDDNAKNKEDNTETSTLRDFFNDQKHLKISPYLFNEVDTPFPDTFCFPNERDNKLDAITKIPVLVATIDYMINGLDAGRSSKTRFLTRLMTSDIIIDEIDSYNQNDLMAIHKLAYLVGFYGKKLIISSATLPELLIESFYLAYSTGYQRFKIYADKHNAPLYLAFFTHFKALNQVNEVSHQNKPINDIITPFVDKFYQQIKQEPVKRRATVLDISQYLHQNITRHEAQYKKLAPLYAKIFASAQQLHTSNQTQIDGIAISTGLIKFNNTEDAYHFCHYLFDADDLEQEAIVKIECYHAKHFPIRRSYTEKVLQKLLNRKKSNGFKKHAIVKSAVKQAQQEGKKHIMLLVVSTTIIEIGRDFDFDWGIIEPRSHWSIVQTVGRIMRHRTAARPDNVVLLSHSMKVVRRSKTNNGFYARPGAEITDNDCILDNADQCKPIEELFEYTTLKDKIDASITLKNTAGQPIKNLENQQIEYFLKGTEIASLQSYLTQPLEYLSTFNANQNPFRGKYQPHYLYQQTNYQQWIILDKKTGQPHSADQHFELISLKHPSRCLLDKSLTDMEEEYAKDGIMLEQEIISTTKPENTKKYNELLGVL
jgi:CRISPR-associated endonuclease/helicase Cas3